MKLELNDKPREFVANDVTISDYGKVLLNSNEMVSFKTESSKEYDFVAKEWGYYATPSLNGRLINEGFKTALVVNEYNKAYVMVVDIDKMDIFYDYLKTDKQKLVSWLDEWFGE